MRMRLRSMVERFVPSTPFVSTFLTRCGQILGSPPNCERLLASGEVAHTASTTTNERGTTTLSTTRYTPEYGFAGYTQQSESFTTYPKYVEIDAYDIRKSKPGENLRHLTGMTK